MKNSKFIFNVIFFIILTALSAGIVFSAHGRFYTLYCGCEEDVLKTYQIFALTPNDAVLKANHSFKNLLSDQMGYKRKDMAEKQCGCGLVPKKKFIDFED